VGAARVVVAEPGPNGPFTVLKLLDLVAAQADDCGIELTPYPVPTEDRNEMIDNFPHTVPGQREPFDLALFAMDTRTDPDNRMWESTEIASPDRPTGLNYMGFANPRVDAVLRAARRTTNVDERARLYAEFQDIVFEERAMLFLYYPRETTGLSPRVVTQGRDLETELWWSPLETLELTSP